jgi:hypothetical protein
MTFMISKFFLQKVITGDPKNQSLKSVPAVSEGLDTIKLDSQQSPCTICG